MSNSSQTTLSETNESKPQGLLWRVLVLVIVLIIVAVMVFAVAHDIHQRRVANALTAKSTEVAAQKNTAVVPIEIDTTQQKKIASAKKDQPIENQPAKSAPVTSPAPSVINNKVATQAVVYNTTGQLILSDVNQAVNRAANQVLIQRNSASALQTLQQAQGLLLLQHRVASPVQASLAKLISLVSQLPQLNLKARIQRWVALQQQVGSLHFRLPIAHDTPTTVAEGHSWYRRAWHDLTHRLGQLVVVQHNNKISAAVLTQAGRIQLVASLQTWLSLAQQSLLTGNQAAYHTAVLASVRMVKQWFVNDAAQHKMVSTLQQLAQLPVSYANAALADQFAEVRAVIIQTSLKIKK